MSKKKRPIAVDMLPATKVFGVPVARAIGINDPSWDYHPATTWIRNVTPVRPDESGCRHVFIQDGFDSSVLRCKHCDHRMQVGRPRR